LPQRRSHVPEEAEAGATEIPSATAAQAIASQARAAVLVTRLPL
jgi:hypothetical protein